MASSRSNERKFVVLMTACLAPKLLADGTPPVRRWDPVLRLRDYTQGLTFWLTHPDPRLDGVVFADNSGRSLTPLRETTDRLAVDRPVEFLSFDQPPTPVGMSYGYSEFLLVRTALQRSRLLSACSHFIKATGRYSFPGIARLLDRLPPDFRAAVDVRGCRPRPWRSNPIVSAALALFQRKFYIDTLADLPDQMRPAPPWNRRQFIEPMWYDALIEYRDDPTVILRWPVNCEPEGVGGDGTRYDSLRQRVARALRSMGRRCAPGWWL